MLMKLACLEVRVDWAELAERLGHPPWNSNVRPCPCCNAYGLGLYAIAGVTLELEPWRTTTDDDIEAATTTCELQLVLDRKHRDTLIEHMEYDKRTGTGASRGRRLISD